MTLVLDIAESTKEGECYSQGCGRDQRDIDPKLVETNKTRAFGLQSQKQKSEYGRRHCNHTVLGTVPLNKAWFWI